MPVSPVSTGGRVVNTASLPIATPCWLAPISAPHIQNGRLSSTPWVRSTCGISIQVQRTLAAGECSRGAAPVEQLGLVGVAVRVLGEQHALGPNHHDRVAHCPVPIMNRLRNRHATSAAGRKEGIGDRVPASLPSRSRSRSRQFASAPASVCSLRTRPARLRAARMGTPQPAEDPRGIRTPIPESRARWAGGLSAIRYPLSATSRCCPAAGTGTAGGGRCAATSGRRAAAAAGAPTSGRRRGSSAPPPRP